MISLSLRKLGRCAPNPFVKPCSRYKSSRSIREPSLLISDAEKSTDMDLTPSVKYGIFNAQNWVCFKSVLFVCNTIRITLFNQFCALISEFFGLGGTKIKLLF